MCREKNMACAWSMSWRVRYAKGYSSRYGDTGVSTTKNIKWSTPRKSKQITARYMNISYVRTLRAWCPLIWLLIAHARQCENPIFFVARKKQTTSTASDTYAHQVYNNTYAVAVHVLPVVRSMLQQRCATEDETRWGVARDKTNAVYASTPGIECTNVQ